VVVVDTSVWIDVFRDRTGKRKRRLVELLGADELVLTRFTQLELLQGCRDEREWSLLSGYLDTQDYLEVSPESWRAAARLYFELRRGGKTVRSPIDCCIAQLCLDHGALLLHRDRDFETVASASHLSQRFVQWS